MSEAEPTSPREQPGNCSRCGYYADDASNLNQPASDHRFADHDALCRGCIRRGNRIDTVEAAFDRDELHHYDSDGHDAVYDLARNAVETADADAITMVCSQHVNDDDDAVTVRAVRTPHPRGGVTPTDHAVAVVRPYAGPADVYAGSAAVVYAALTELVRDHDWPVRRANFALRLDDEP